MARRNRENEEVMVVHRDDIFANGSWMGINPEFSRLLKVVRQCHKFLPRFGKNGVDETYTTEWLQVIPFGVLSAQEKIFSYVKSNRSSETRLHGERMIGIAGHLRKRDTTDYGSLIGWFRREWCEEIRYEGLPFAFPIGVIYDPSRQVSAAHLGFAFLLMGDELSVRINAGEELEEAKWWSLEELTERDQKEKARGLLGIDNWSLEIMKYLNNNPDLLAS
ncbi:MAG: hypothetical protein HYT98_04185 [Candidatus Sungbacteria bacterium]|nr:hypothetical protein [Candidatus Sungbacteria bacterium]